MKPAPSRLRRTLVAVTAFAATVAVTGCTQVQSTSSSTSSPSASANYGAPASASQVTDGGTLTFALSADPGTLDPATSTALVTKHVFAAMCYALYRYSDKGKLEPQLASGQPTISDDGKSYVIPLRTDAVFADGTKMDAAAVVTTLKRNIDLPGSQRKSELGPVDAITAVDSSHVRVTFTKAYSPFQSVLADRPGMVLSPTALQKEGDSFGTNPVCVGPFKFASQVSNTSVTLEKDPRFYDAKDVHLDKIVYQVTPDANVRAANIENGGVQLTDTLSPQDMSKVSSTSGVTVLQALNLGFQGMHINLTAKDSPLASSKLVRRALSYAVNRKALTQAVFKGWYDTACGPISPASPYSVSSDQKCDDDNAAKAKSLLKQAGVTTPVKIELTVPNQQDPLRYAQALQSQVKDAGFDIEIHPVEFATVLQDVIKKNYQAVLLGWAGRPDPDGNISIYLQSDGSSNYTGYKNPTVDSLIAQAQETSGIDARAKIYAKIITQANEDMPYVYLYRQRSLVAENGVTGVTIDQSGVIHPEYAGILKDK